MRNQPSWLIKLRSTQDTVSGEGSTFGRHGRKMCVFGTLSTSFGTSKLVIHRDSKPFSMRLGLERNLYNHDATVHSLVRLHLCMYSTVHTCTPLIPYDSFFAPRSFEYCRDALLSRRCQQIMSVAKLSMHKLFDQKTSTRARLR
jgi:hypothetical protein